MQFWWEIVAFVVHFGQFTWFRWERLPRWTMTAAASTFNHFSWTFDWNWTSNETFSRKKAFAKYLQKAQEIPRSAIPQSERAKNHPKVSAFFWLVESRAKFPPPSKIDQSESFRQCRSIPLLSPTFNGDSRRKFPLGKHNGLIASCRKWNNENMMSQLVFRLAISDWLWSGAAYQCKNSWIFNLNYRRASCAKCIWKCYA